MSLLTENWHFEAFCRDKFTVRISRLVWNFKLIFVQSIGKGQMRTKIRYIASKKWYINILRGEKSKEDKGKICAQRELFLSEVNNRKTIAATEANNDTYCLQNE